MKSLESYRGREQTYLKHFFLERYLERVAYNIGSFAQEFVYVDGFSGPWRSTDQEFEDTSFMIAVRKLREVRDAWAKRKPARSLKVRCIFVEENPKSFKALQSAISTVEDMEISPINGSFEDVIPQIASAIGSAFALVFIDPTGWTGFGLQKIRPLLLGQREVLVNFMFDFINRFFEDDRKGTEASLTELFGGSGWDSALLSSADREEAILRFYQERMREIGGFKYVTSTRIMKPVTDRSYFHLVYGTRHHKGLIEFREVERRFVEEQERVRLDTKQDQRVSRTGQTELFKASDHQGVAVRGFAADQAANQKEAADRILRLLGAGPARYQDALGAVLELPLVWESWIKQTLVDWRSDGRIQIDGLGPKQKVPRVGCVLRLGSG